MKIKSHKYLNFLVFIIALSLFNCQEEKLESSAKVLTDSVKIKKISLDEFKDKSKVEDYLRKFNSKEKSNVLNRMVYDSINDFMVYTDEFTIIENGNRDWLVFNIFRDYETAYLENLVLMNTNNGEYTSKLYRYDFDENDINTIEGGGVVNDLYDKTTIINLETFDTNIFLEMADIPLPYIFCEMADVV